MLFDTNAPKIIARDPTALIALSDREMGKLIEPQVQSLGFRTEVITVMNDILMALKSRNFDLIVISEEYEGGGVTENEVLLELIGWTSERRRLRYCVLVGEGMRSGDDLQSFLYSMDFVISVADCENFGAYLQMGLGSKQESLAKLNEVNRREEIA